MASLFVAPPRALPRVTMGEGRTPVATIRVGDREVTAKLEFESPTRSFKDRGAAFLLSAALDAGATRVVADSSGNAGVAIAAYAAHAGVACEVFVAASTPAETLDRIAADVHLVEGSREDVAAAAIARVQSTGAFYASHVWNPWFVEGTKHYVDELIEQLGARLPDVLVLPVGNGTLVLGAWRAMQENGSTARIVGVQAEACAPIAAAFHAGRNDVDLFVDRGTTATGVAIAAPVRGREILAAIRATEGTVVTVSESEIADATAALLESGFDVEPTAAVPVAALAHIDSAEAVVPIASARRATPARDRPGTR